MSGVPGQPPIIPPIIPPVVPPLQPPSGPSSFEEDARYRESQGHSWTYRPPPAPVPVDPRFVFRTNPQVWVLEFALGFAEQSTVTPVPFGRDKVTGTRRRSWRSREREPVGSWDQVGTGWHVGVLDFVAKGVADSTRIVSCDAILTAVDRHKPWIPAAVPVTSPAGGLIAVGPSRINDSWTLPDMTFGWLDPSAWPQAAERIAQVLTLEI